MKSLKKIVLFLLILSMICLTGCELPKFEDKKDDPVETVNKYIVKFDDKNVQVEEGKTVPELNHLEKEGYNFIGWTLNGVLFDFSTPITSDIELVSKYEQISLNVIFDIKGQKETVSVLYGETITKPIDPVSEGLVFSAWYENGKEFDFNDKITKDITLVAVFESDTVKVTFDNEGTKDEKIIDWNTKVTKPQDPVKEGYNFVGWYLNDSLFEFDTNVVEDITLVAHFAINKCYVYFDVDGSRETKEVEWNTTVQAISDPVKTGYTFTGWYYKEQLFDFNSKITADIIIYAQFEINTYTVTFKVDSTTYDTKTVNYNTKVTKPTDPTKTGYTFVCWKNGSSEYNFNTLVTSDITLNAEFEINTYTVTFKVDGATYDTKTVNYNTKVTKPTNPTKTGYTFKQWKNSSNVYNFDTLVTSDITLNAEFEINTYTVTFKVDGTTYDTKTINYNTKVTKPTDPTKTGYTFACWKNGSSEYNFNTLVTSDITLNATFNINTYTVTFKVDGSTYDTKTVNYNTKVTKPNNPTKNGYTFKQWNISSSAYNFDTLVTSNIELSAEFTLNKVNTINVTYDFGYNCYQTKNDLRVAYYTDFYNFLLNKNYDFTTYNINNLNDFLTFIDLWTYSGRSEMGSIGTAFGSYYVKKDIGGVLEDQPESVFIGWCYKNNKYIDFIHHLETFFAYWRTDEGYTTSTNNGNDFYAEPWASMVDTAKFFHFTSSNLQNTYAWFDSERVHYALDHIPGVGYVTLTTESTSAITLPADVTRSGYEFLGWFDADGDSVTVATTTMTVYAHWADRSLEDLAEEFMNDFNTVLGKSYSDASKLDTSKLESDYMVTFGQNSAMTTKWMWLYKALADANNDTSKYPDASGFSWSTNKGFFLANLCGFFTRTQHEDTYLHNVSADYSDSSLVNTILNLDKVTVAFYIDGSLYKTETIDKNTKVSVPTAPVKEGYTFVGWNLGTSSYDFNQNVTSNINLTAEFEINDYTVTYMVDGSTYTTETVSYHENATRPTNPIKAGYSFRAWMLDDVDYNFTTLITGDITLIADFTEIPETGVYVTYDFGYECYQTKDDLRLAYYTDFYNFLVSKGHGEFTASAGTNVIGTFTVNDLDSFLQFMDTWQLGDRKEMGFIGNELASYYLTVDVGGSIEDQPTTTFIGWCYQNNKYRPFLQHLMTFFEYWRTDEGYSKTDPNGNDFFASGWASMVDTAKFFHFTSSTLRTKNNAMYSWFNSARVDYALDHIPGVGRVSLVTYDDTSITLPTDITRPGYTFTGWVDGNGASITTVTSSMTVYATWEKDNTPVYTIRAEASTNATSGSETNWYCATPSQTQNGYLWGHRIILVSNGNNYTVSEILTGNGVAPTGTYAYRIVHYDGGYQTFDEAIEVGQTVTATQDGNYIIFNFYD